MKTIVITGASTGIGLATVKTCLLEGYNVIATARSEQDLLALRTLGATAISLELADKTSVEQAAHTIIEAANKKIDVLFNNAGYGLQVAMEDASWEGLLRQHTTNVIGPIHLTNQLLPALKPGSKIIFNSSILGLITVAFRGPYCMSKHALESAADAYRLELESLGIDVHVIEPGPIEADFRKTAFQALNEVLGNKQPRLDYSRHITRLTNVENTPGTLPAQACADIVLDIIKGRKKAMRYRITEIAKKAAIAKRLLGSHFHSLARKAEPVGPKKKA